MYHTWLNKGGSDRSEKRKSIAIDVLRGVWRQRKRIRYEQMYPVKEPIVQLTCDEDMPKFNPNSLRGIAMDKINKLVEDPGYLEWFEKEEIPICIWEELSLRLRKHFHFRCFIILDIFQEIHDVTNLFCEGCAERRVDELNERDPEDEDWDDDPMPVYELYEYAHWAYYDKYTKIWNGELLCDDEDIFGENSLFKCPDCYHNPFNDWAVMGKKMPKWCKALDFIKLVNETKNMCVKEFSLYYIK